MTYRAMLWGLCLVLFTSVAAADYLEIRKNANIYKEPNRFSDNLKRIDIGQIDRPYLVKLVSDDKVNGYYKIRLRGNSAEGWVYKTLVRRYDRQHPDYVPYKRSLYRHWIDADGNCRNTRAEVLIRDSDNQEVEFKGDENCRVTEGSWLDPYTGTTFHSAKKVDVDHVVPLKNAHESGGWAWSRDKRREYANYMVYRDHLLAVSASENRRKGAKGPDKYLPPDNSYHCEYIEIWSNIKEEWELEMTEDEGEVVQQILDRCS